MGVADKIVGKVKETAGRLTNNSDLEAEGSAQADKGEAEIEASKAEAEAKGHEAKAELKDTEMRAHED